MKRTNFAHWEQLAVLHGTGPDGRCRCRVGLGPLNGDERGPACPLPILYTLLASKPAASQSL